MQCAIVATAVTNAVSIIKVPYPVSTSAPAFSIPVVATTATANADALGIVSADPNVNNFQPIITPRPTSTFLPQVIHHTTARFNASSTEGESASGKSAAPSHGLGTGAKAGIAIGILLLIGLAAVAVWFVLRRRKRMQKPDPALLEDQSEMSHTGESISSAAPHRADEPMPYGPNSYGQPQQYLSANDPSQHNVIGGDGENEGYFGQGNAGRNDGQSLSPRKQVPGGRLDGYQVPYTAQTAIPPGRPFGQEMPAIPAMPEAYRPNDARYRPPSPTSVYGQSAHPGRSAYPPQSGMPTDREPVLFPGLKPRA